MLNRETLYVFSLSKAPIINGLNIFNSENYKNSDTSKFVGFKNSFIRKVDIVIITKIGRELENQLMITILELLSKY